MHTVFSLTAWKTLTLKQLKQNRNNSEKKVGLFHNKNTQEKKNLTTIGSLSDIDFSIFLTKINKQLHRKAIKNIYIALSGKNLKNKQGGGRRKRWKCC